MTVLGCRRRLAALREAYLGQMSAPDLAGPAVSLKKPKVSELWSNSQVGPP